MDRVQAWRRGGGDLGGLKNRLDLLLGVDAWTTPTPEQLWNSRIIALASEGRDLHDIEAILTKDWPEHDGLRTKWELEDSRDEQWDSAKRSRAKSVLWDFAKVTIQMLNKGLDGKRGLGVAKISEKISIETGFTLPPSTMTKQLQAWKEPLRGTGSSPPVIQPGVWDAGRSQRDTGLDSPITSSNSTASLEAESQGPRDRMSSPPPKKQRREFGSSTTRTTDHLSSRRPGTPSVPSQIPQKISSASLARPNSIQTEFAALKRHMAIQNYNYKLFVEKCNDQAKDFDHRISEEKTAREKAVQELEAKIYSLQEKNIRLEGEISRLKHRIGELLQIIEMLESKNTEFESLVVQLKEEKCSLQQQLEKCHASLGESQNNLEKSHISLERSHLVLDQLKMKIKTLSENKGSEPLDQQIGHLHRALSYVSIDEHSREVRIDSGYHDDLECRKSINFVPLSFQRLVHYNAAIDMSSDSITGASAKRCGIVGRASSVNGESVGELPRLSSEMDTRSSTSSAHSAINAIEDGIVIESLRLNATDTHGRLPNASMMIAHVGGADEIPENAPEMFQELYDMMDFMADGFDDRLWGRSAEGVSF